MDVRAVREQLAAALNGATLSGGASLTGYDVIPDDPVLPCHVVRPPLEVLYHQAHARRSAATWTVTIVAPRNDESGGQHLIDEVMSWPGIAKQIEEYEADAWESVVVNSSRDVRQLVAGNTTGLAVDLLVTVNTIAR